MAADPNQSPAMRPDAFSVPPRLSDLHGQARAEALRARALAARERYLRERHRYPPRTGLLTRCFASLSRWHALPPAILPAA